MAHFAEIDDSDIVQRVIVIADEDCLDEDGNESEAVGAQFCVNTVRSGTLGHWKQTSYRALGGKKYDPETGEEIEGTALRKNYAGPGYKYDSTRDAFIGPRRFDSWKLNEDTCQWDAPVPYPSADEHGLKCESTDQYYWDEELYQQDRTKGWVLS